jgi:hypothetical protein
MVEFIIRKIDLEQLFSFWKIMATQIKTYKNNLKVVFIKIDIFIINSLYK